MKITGIETIPVSVPLRPRFMIRASRGTHSASPFLLVKVHTDEGVVGLGEVSCTPRWSGEDHFSAQHFIQSILAPMLIGQDPSQIEALTAKLDQGVAANYFTKAALEMALWDIFGKSVGLPVYRLLGGRVREEITTKWSVSGLEPERAAEIASWAASEGFHTVKVKVGIEPGADLARVKAVRSAVGDEIRIGVDANGGWSRAAALRTAERLKEYDIFFVEQPLTASDIPGMAHLRRRIGLPLIADESLYSPQDAVKLVRADAADVFSVYVGKAGGIGPARRITAIAESAGIACTIGSNLEMGVGTAAMIHLAMASAAVRSEDFPCDVIGPLYYEDDLLLEPLPVGKGKARPLERPGLGVELDEKKIQRYRVC